MRTFELEAGRRFLAAMTALDACEKGDFNVDEIGKILDNIWGQHPPEVCVYDLMFGSTALVSMLGGVVGLEFNETVQLLSRALEAPA